jgi:peptide deformylase
MSLKTWPHECLRKVCIEVDMSCEPDVALLLPKMKALVTEYEAHGIAANQVGSTLRVCVVSADRGKTHKVMINPKIINSGGEFIGDEACLSFPGVLVPIKRFAACEVEYLNESFEPQVEQLMGFDAIVAQHEIDHLDGITLFNRAPKVDKAKIQRQITKSLRTMKKMSQPQKMPKALYRQIQTALKNVANRQDSGIGPDLGQNSPELPTPEQIMNATGHRDMNGFTGPQG